jgi:hypothetical protein
MIWRTVRTRAVTSGPGTGASSPPAKASLEPLAARHDKVGEGRPVAARSQPTAEVNQALPCFSHCERVLVKTISAYVDL